MKTTIIALAALAALALPAAADHHEDRPSDEQFREQHQRLERHVQEIREHAQHHEARMNHIRRAIENLVEANMHDAAKHLEQQAEGMQREFRTKLEEQEKIVERGRDELERHVRERRDASNHDDKDLQERPRPDARPGARPGSDFAPALRRLHERLEAIERRLSRLEGARRGEEREHDRPGTERAEREERDRPHDRKRERDEGDGEKH